MRFLKLLIFILSFAPGYTQSKSGKIIYATSSKNVNVFFESPITTAIVGSSSFVFAYSKEERSTIGLLKAVPGLESNLLITTENGNIFSFIIRYKKDVEELNHFISDSLAIGNTKGKIATRSNDMSETGLQDELSDLEQSSGTSAKISKPVTINDFDSKPSINISKYSPKSNDKYETDRLGYFEEYCKKEVEAERFFKRFYASSDKVFIRMKNISYNRDELYFTLIIDNQSSLDYDVEDFKFYITARNKSRKTSTQTIAYTPEFIYQQIERIEAFTSKEVVYVFKKFSINSEKLLVVAMSEYKGERNINLEIQNTTINNPN